MKTPYEFEVKPKEAMLDDNYSLVLSQNTPNPVGEYTQISFSISNDAYVDLSLYNLLGQKLHTFVASKVKGTIKHSINWNGAIRGSKLQTGVYIYELRVNGKRKKRKLIIK